MDTFRQAVKQAKGLLRNRAKCDLVTPWHGLYIVQCNDDDCYRGGSHYHTATQKEMNTFYHDQKAVEYVTL